MTLTLLPDTGPPEPEPTGGGRITDRQAAVLLLHHDRLPAGSEEARALRAALLVARPCSIDGYAEGWRDALTLARITAFYAMATRSQRNPALRYSVAESDACEEAAAQIAAIPPPKPSL